MGMNVLWNFTSRRLNEDEKGGRRSIDVGAVFLNQPSNLTRDCGGIMAKSAVLEYFAAVDQDKSLRAEAQQAFSTGIDAIVVAGVKHGYHFSQDDLRAVIREQLDSLMPPDEIVEIKLDNVAGGIGSATGGAGAGKVSFIGSLRNRLAYP